MLALAVGVTAILAMPAWGGAVAPLSGEREGFALGAEELVQSEGADILVLGYSVPSCADWNGDTLPDLIVGEGGGGYDGRVRVYLNVGTLREPVLDADFFAQSTGGDLVVPPAGCLGAFPRLVHWDGDGRKDLIVSLGDGRVMVFFNTGTDQDPLFDDGTPLQAGPPGQKVDIDVGDRATATVVDWNNDGRKDLVVGALDGYIHLFLSEGTSMAPDFVDEQFAQASGGPLLVETYRSSPAVGDVTEDGRKDLVVGDTDGRLLMWVNLGTDDSPYFGDYAEVLSDGVPIDLPSSRSRPALCDWDNDGAVDVLIGSSDGTVRLYRNLGTLFADGFESGDTEEWSFTNP